MDDTSAVTLEESARDAFLGVGGTAVLSFAAGVDQPPYSIPVSYGYDADGEVFYLRLGFVDGSEKAAMVADERPVSLVTHSDTEAGWTSVVATGVLAEITEADVGSAGMQGLERVEIPLLDIFERPDQEVEFRFFRLDPDTISGRREVPR